MSQAISNLPVGSLVKDLATTYPGAPISGSPIIWMIVDKNHSGYPTSSVTLQTYNTLFNRYYDEDEPDNTYEGRQRGGNNRYIYCNARIWLNSISAGTWYSAQHSADVPPTFSSSPGFLSTFSTKMKAALLSTTLIVGKDIADGNGTENCIDKIFLPSIYEIDAVKGALWTNVPQDGNQFSYYSGSSYANGYSWYLRTPYDDAVLNTNSTTVGEFVASTYPTTKQIQAVACSIDSSNKGLRPCCNITNTTLVSETTNSDGYYVLFASSPTTPSGITIPTELKGNQSAIINWGASTDADSNLSGYKLERSVNSGAYTQIYSGTALTYTDTIPVGTDTIQYRVKSFDATELESAYNTSESRTVINNTTPIIDGIDSDLGTKAAAFSTSYTITDPDTANTLTTVEKIDGIIKRTYSATSGTANSFDITADEWLKLLNGSHTLAITVNDGVASAVTRTYTFTKNETEIEFQLTAPLSTSAQITKAIMSVVRTIPTGATFDVEICNNGFDASPTWETVTNNVINGSKIMFSNITKTADNWGFNFRIKINRGSATGDCFISSVGGNFE